MVRKAQNIFVSMVIISFIWVNIEFYLNYINSKVITYTLYCSE